MGAPTSPTPTPLRNAYWVVPGKVLAGEHPGGTNREATRERLQRLVAAGVECFIDLTEPGELKPYDPELPFGIEYLRKPIRDHGIPAQRVHMAEILDCIHDAVQSGRCVYIHCRAGIGRTGTVVGCLLVERGLAGDAALDQLNRLWQFSERSQSWGSVPETDEQVEFVRKWKSRGIFEVESLNFAEPADTDDPDWTATALAADWRTSPLTPAAATGRAPSSSGRFALPDFAAGKLLPTTPVGSPAAANATAPPGAPSPSAPSPPARPASPATAPAASATAVPIVGNAPALATSAIAPTAAGNAPATATGATRAASATAATTAARAPAPATGAALIVSASAPTPAAQAPGANPAATIATPDNDPLLDPEVLAAAGILRDRFLGALLGLAIGDAVAAATQYRRPGTFSPVGDMLGGGPFDLPRGGWSDDTAMALCLADSLLERDGFDARDQVERYRRWQQEGYLSATGQCLGITASTARAIAMAQWRRQAFSGSHDPSQVDPEPLSRVAPAVLFFFASSGPAVDQAPEAARTTCQAPAVLEACRSLARALYAALSGQPKAVILERAVPAAVAPGGATAALAAAVAAFGATDNFRDAVLYAANLGGDSDVAGAVCGQLAGAYYTVKAIPTSWYNGLMRKELIAAYADRLLAHAMLGLSS